LAKITVFLSIFILCWFILYLLVGGMAGLKGPIMSIIVLEILGLFLGLLVKAFGCPALLAPLALGIVLRNVPELDLTLGGRRTILYSNTARLFSTTTSPTPSSMPSAVITTSSWPRVIGSTQSGKAHPYIHNILETG
jgi:hypothetical protein